MNSKKQIQDFLHQPRIAVIGVSRDSKDYSRMVFRAFQERGFAVVPIHPTQKEVEGVRCFAKVQEADPPVTAALILTAPALTDSVVRDCVEAGIGHIWLRRSHETAEEFCRKKGIPLVSGECPLMFLSDMQWPHRLHGWVNRLVGTYPA